MLDWFYVTAGGILVGFYLRYISIVWAAIFITVLALFRFIIVKAECDVTLQFYERFGKPVESLRGRVVWITGASTGIGAALAVRLAQAGVKLVLSARSPQNLEVVKKQCVGTGGVSEKDVLALTLDMTHYDKHQPAFDQVIQHFGQLDILVNNAGRSQRGRWECIETEVDKELFDLNVFSLIALSRIALRYFLQRGVGHLVVNSSLAGKVGAPLSGSYTGSKHALQGYFESLRVEQAGTGVDITMLCPGPVESNLLNLVFTEKLGQALDQQRAGRRMSSERCAELIAVSVANRLSETWISEQPALSFTYMVQYMPATIRMFFRMVPLKFIMKMRDGKDVMKKTE